MPGTQGGKVSQTPRGLTQRHAVIGASTASAGVQGHARARTSDQAHAATKLSPWPLQLQQVLCRLSYQQLALLFLHPQLWLHRAGRGWGGGTSSQCLPQAHPRGSFKAGLKNHLQEVPLDFTRGLLTVPRCSNCRHPPPTPPFISSIITVTTRSLKRDHGARSAHGRHLTNYCICDTLVRAGPTKQARMYTCMILVMYVCARTCMCMSRCACVCF